MTTKLGLNWDYGSLYGLDYACGGLCMLIYANMHCFYADIQLGPFEGTWPLQVQIEDSGRRGGLCFRAGFSLGIKMDVKMEDMYTHIQT